MAEGEEIEGEMERKEEVEEAGRVVEEEGRVEGFSIDMA